MTQITDSDREAAKALALTLFDGNFDPEAIRDTFIDAFKNHRIQSTTAMAAEIERLKETIRRVQASVRTLSKAQEEIYTTYARNSALNNEAVNMLDSERDANAIMTDEIERLKAEVERLNYNGIHTCSDACQRLPCVQRREIEQLRKEKAGALELLEKWSTWACGQQGPSPFQETRTFLGQQEQRT